MKPTSNRCKNSDTFISVSNFNYYITIYILYLFFTSYSLPESLQKQLYVDKDVNQIEEFSFLSQSSNKATFHLVTHGKPGKLLIEGKWFNAKEIARFLTPKILNSTFKIQNLNIYGCEFAKGDQGIEAIKYLEAELGLKIAASDDVTGKDGDWELEVGNHFVQGLENYKYNLQCTGTAGGTAPVDDFDGDGVCNDTDIDDDNDGVLDVDENFCGRSAANPFTSLEQARATVKRAGIYYFNLSGNKFSTHVNTDGYVLVAVDYGNGSGVLPVTPNLGLDRTYNKRGLLNPAALAALGTVERIRISSNTSSAGGLDVTSINTTLIDRVKNNKSLQRGNEGTDNTLNDSWTGLNAGYLNADAKSITSVTTNSLRNNIIHISGNNKGFHWVPQESFQRVYWDDEEGGGEIPDQDYFALWVRGNATGTACYTNTDGTASPNHMDLDSDDDGCSDAFEAGATNDKTTNYKFTSAESTPKDGLVDMVDNGANGGTSRDGKPDYIFRAYYPYDAMTNYCKADLDNDGVLNQTDLDDDNDGILDTSEINPYTINTVTNPTFNTDTNGWTLTGDWRREVDTDDPSSTYLGNNDDLVSNEDAQQRVVLKNNCTPRSKFTLKMLSRSFISATGSESNLWAETDVYIGEKHLFKLANPNGPTSSPQATVTRGRDYESVVQSFTIDGTAVGASGHSISTNKLHDFELILNTTNLPSMGEIRFRHSASGDDVYLDNVYYRVNECLDTDNDSVPNIFDLDSDADGCPDAIEGDGNFKLADLQIAFNDGGTPEQNQNLCSGSGCVDSNGVPAAAAGGQNVGMSQTKNADTDGDGVADTCEDTDNDGVFDSVDVDDDNDGILDLKEGACLDGISPQTAFTKLSQARNVPSGRYYFNLGNGTFQADVDNSEGGGWVLVLQYVHKGGTDPKLSTLYPGDDFPVTSTAILGTDESSVAKKWGHAGNTALNQFSENFEIRFYGETNDHNRKIHFKTTLGTSYVKIGSGSFSGLETSHTLLSGHNANLPANTNGHYSNQDDLALTNFPFYHNGLHHWGVKAAGQSRWEVDNAPGNSSKHTIHKVWVRSVNTSESCTPVDTDGVDDVPNHLDLDSDNDGCPDLVEAGVSPTTEVTNAGATNNGGGSWGIENPTNAQLNPTGTDANNDGLNDSVDKNDSGVLDGEVNYPSTYHKYAVYDDLNYCTDTDKDGISDFKDIDDDNDGIIDIKEQKEEPCTYKICDSWIDLPLKAGTTDPATIIVDGEEITYTITTNQDFKSQGGTNWNTFQCDLGTMTGLSHWQYVNANNQMVTFNFSKPVTNFQFVLSAIEDIPETVQIVTNNTESQQTICPSCNKSRIEPVDANTTNVHGGGKNAEIFNVSGPTYTTVSVEVTAVGGKFLLAYGICNLSRRADPRHSDIDTDGDGISNRLDLDSDGDSCPDAVESGTAKQAGEGNTSMGDLENKPEDGGIKENVANAKVGDGSPENYGENGFYNNIETNDSQTAEYEATYTYDYATSKAANFCTDKDADGTPNFIDLDDDNDGVLDDNECSTPFQEITPPDFDYGESNEGYYGGDLTKTVDLSSKFGLAEGSVIVTIEGGSYHYFSEYSTYKFVVTKGKPIHFTFTGTVPVKVRAGQGSLIDASVRDGIAANDIKQYTFTTTLNASLSHQENPPSQKYVINNSGSTINNSSGDFIWESSRESQGGITFYTTDDPGGSGTFNNRISLELSPIWCDPDKDGVSNQLDLDSDGDICPDVVESGVKNYIKRESLSVELVSGDVENKDPDNPSSTTTSTPTEGAMINPTNGGDAVGPNGFHDQLEQTSPGMYDNAMYKEDTYVYRFYNACRQRKIYSNPAMHTFRRSIKTQ